MGQTAEAAEAGVQGVQLHTHFLSSSFIKDQVLFQKDVFPY